MALPPTQWGEVLPRARTGLCSEQGLPQRPGPCHHSGHTQAERGPSPEPRLALLSKVAPLCPLQAPDTPPRCSTLGTEASPPSCTAHCPRLSRAVPTRTGPWARPAPLLHTEGASGAGTGRPDGARPFSFSWASLTGKGCAAAGGARGLLDSTVGARTDAQRRVPAPASPQRSNSAPGQRDPPRSPPG